MGTAKHVGRIGHWRSRWEFGMSAQRHADDGVDRRAVLVVMATVVPVSTVAPEVRLGVKRVYGTDVDGALIMGGTTGPTPDDAYIEVCQEPVHRADSSGPGHRVRRGDDARGVVAHHAGSCASSGSRWGPRLWGFGGPAWPDAPWWKLSGLFDLTIDQSVQAGVADLEDAMAEHPATTIW